MLLFSILHSQGDALVNLTYNPDTEGPVFCSVSMQANQKKDSEERCHITQGEKSIQKFAKGNESAINPTETDNIMDFRLGNGL